LPLRFNDGTAVPKALIAGVVTEIERRFFIDLKQRLRARFHPRRRT
jgi:hypothetical protein